jgi:DNA repair exonuclease SbcCD nuclease subunit
MNLLHIADIHLDRVFHRGESRPAASRRRAELRDALTRALELGRARQVDAVCIAGDVYEHEYVSEDTVSFLHDSFSRTRVPVLVAPGNHDPYLPGSVWQRTDWPANVHVFARDAVEPFPLGPSVTVWGAAFTARDAGPGALARFRAPDDGRTHVLLVHAALTGEQWADEAGHRPVTRAQLQATGAAYAMLGHFHDGRGDGFLCYPGSPEPLDWGERSGAHGASIVRIDAGRVSAEPVPLATRRYVERTVSVAGAAGSAQVEAAVSAVAAQEAGASLRVVLAGEIEPGCEIDPPVLAERCGAGLTELAVVDRTVPAYDLDAIAREPTVRGRFVARLRASGEPDASEAILAGLRALDGRPEVIGAG